MQKLLLGVALLGLAVGWCWWRWPIRSLPRVNMQVADPQVAAALRQRMDEVQRHPRSGSAWGWLGALLWAYDFRPEAGKCLGWAERLEPGNARWPYYHALTLLIATPNRAIPLLYKTTRICGNSPEAPRYRLAHLLAEQGRWDEARREFEPLLSARPGFTPARLLAARGAQARGDLETALRMARDCIEDSRTARSALVLLASIYRQKGDTAAAAQALRHSSQLPEDSGFEDPYRAEVTLLRSDPRALSDQAHPLLASGHLREAAALIDRLQQQHPEYPDTWLLAGRLHFLRKDLPAAEQSLQRHLQLNPRSAQGLFQLGSVLLAREQWTNAAAIFAQATQVKPDFGPAHYNRGIALGRAGQTRAAMEAFRESLRYNPERLESYLLLADLHWRQGEQDAASQLLEQARAINPNDPRLKAFDERIRRKKSEY